MITDLWLYQYPLWVSHYKSNILFGLLPTEIIKKINTIMITDILKQRLIIKNLNSTKTQIINVFNHNIENFHFQNGNKLCDIHIVKSILINISKTLNKPITISHICCNGNGIVFNYIDNHNILRKKRI